MSEFRPFIATPTHDARVHTIYARGLLGAFAMFPGLGWHVCNATSLGRQRDLLVAEFVKSNCTHLLFVDSDMEWCPNDAAHLFETGRDFVGGTYCRKHAARSITATLLPGQDGLLRECSHLGTGFLLVSRSAIERMLDEYAEDTYEIGGRVFVSLFQQSRHEAGEDLAFSRRWRNTGGQAWLHTGVVLPHYDGNTAYVADPTGLIVPAAAAAEASSLR